MKKEEEEKEGDDEMGCELNVKKMEVKRKHRNEWEKEELNYLFI